MPRRLLRSPLFWIGFCVVLANALYLFGIVDPNPMIVHSNLFQDVGGKLIPGSDNVDANAGFTSQALAHRAMEDWFGGHVPWWDPFEGMGAPLAGGMQSAAFFPFAVFLLLANGQVYMYFVLSLIAAYSTYFLALRLGLRPSIAAVAGICFGLSGGFAVLRFAPENPICFLPVMLLGVEIVRARALARGRTHWWVIALGLALSIVAGFPETTYLDGLFVVVWALVRCGGLAGGALRRYLQANVAGGISGLLLSGPFLAAVYAYIPHAYLSQNVAAHARLEPPAGLPTLFFPYVYGELWTNLKGNNNHVIDGAWSEFGGYLTVALLLLAVFGLFGRRHRGLRIMLAVWSLVIVAAGYGVPGIPAILDVIPGMRHVVVSRFMEATLSFSVILLAAFGIQDLLGSRFARRRVLAVTGATATVAAAAGVYGYETFRKVSTAPSVIYALAWGTATVVVIAGAALTVRRRTGLMRRLAAAALIVILPLEAVVMFVIPELASVRRGTLDRPALTFLKHNLGDQRFATLGPFLPNYGAYFGLAAINVNNNPEPKDFAKLVLTRLQPSAFPATFTGTVRAKVPGVGPARALLKYMRNYEALGVKYVLTTTGKDSYFSETKLRDGRPGPGLKVVYKDALITIYELPHAAPFFQADGSACSLRVLDPGTVRASCSRPATLVRNEIYFPDWSVYVNGKPAALRSTQLHQQSVALPAGTSTVTFTYRPKYATEGWLCLLLGALLCLGSAGAGTPLLRRLHGSRGLNRRHEPTYKVGL